MRFSLSAKELVIVVLIALIYFLLNIYFINYQLVWETISSQHPLSYQATVLISLLGGIWTALNPLSIVLLGTISFLTGITLVLMAQRFSYRSQKTLTFGSMFLGVSSSGCAACGLPVVSLLGLGGSISFLPLHGLEFSVLTIFSLFFSIWLLIKNNPDACPIKSH